MLPSFHLASNQSKPRIHTSLSIRSAALSELLLHLDFWSLFPAQSWSSIPLQYFILQPIAGHARHTGHTSSCHHLGFFRAFPVIPRKNKNICLGGFRVLRYEYGCRCLVRSRSSPPIQSGCRNSPSWNKPYFLCRPLMISKAHSSRKSANVSFVHMTLSRHRRHQYYQNIMSPSDIFPEITSALLHHDHLHAQLVDSSPADSIRPRIQLPSKLNFARRPSLLNRSLSQPTNHLYRPRYTITQDILAFLGTYVRLPPQYTLP